jgi:hypothetical protein
MEIFHAPTFYLVVAALIGYFLPLVSAWIASPATILKHPEVEGVITLVTSTVTGLAATLIHAATTSAEFSWSVWASTTATTLLLSFIGLEQSWRDSAKQAQFRSRGAKPNAVPPNL